jgi:hypothetical protein
MFTPPDKTPYLPPQNQGTVTLSGQPQPNVKAYTVTPADGSPSFTYECLASYSLAKATAMALCDIAWRKFIAAVSITDPLSAGAAAIWWAVNIVPAYNIPPS